MISTSLSIFDVDDTLFKTNTKVHVVSGNRRIASLTAAQQNVYKLKTGEKYDYSDFRSAAHFAAEARPIELVFNAAKKLIEKPNEQNKIIIVTGRTDMDDRDLFLATFRKYGFPVDKTHIYRAGKLNRATPEAKKIIVDNELEKNKYTLVRMFDDLKTNLDAFLTLRTKYQDIQFKAFLVQDETISRYGR